MRTVFFFSFFFTAAFCFHAQEKIPFIFRAQEKRVTRHIHHYLPYDTLVETAKAKIHIYYASDPGKPYLLMLHGMGVDAKTNWYRQVASLSKQYNLLMPDLVYFGKSTAKEEDYSVEFQAAQIHEALLLLGVRRKINVMGFSYGGLVAAMYNQLYAAEINKLVIIDGPVKFFSVHMADSMALAAGVPSMTNIIIPQSVADFKGMEKAVLSKKIPATRCLKLKLVHYYFSPTLPSRQKQINYLGSHQDVYQNYNYNLDKTPTLLVWGAKDGVVPLCVGEKLHARFPLTTQLFVFKKAKHDCHFRYSKVLNKKLVKFLSN